MSRVLYAAWHPLISPRCRPPLCRSIASIHSRWHQRAMAPPPPPAEQQAPFNVVFVLGPPGSGKGTQCKMIAQTFRWVHLSAGDLLRAERSRPDSEFGDMIETHIRNGTIVPVEVTCRLLENAMRAHAPAPGFLVDGFPRNLNNREGWENETRGKVDLRFVLFIQCPQETCISRCLARGQGRTDDNEESLKRRVVTYHEHTRPIIDYYDAMQLVRTVDGSRDSQQVFEDVSKLFS